jgi:hypothetical protein
MFPQLFRAASMDGPELTKRLIEWGEARSARLQRLRAASRLQA